MMTGPPEEFTTLLKSWSDGNRTALDALTPVVYRELRKIARTKLNRERPDHTLQPTALIHEAYMRLVGHDQKQWHSRAHFFAVASEIMRQILVDHARRQGAAKRGLGLPKASFDDALSFAPEKGSLLLALDDALKELAAFDDRKSRVIGMKYFGGLSGEEISIALCISTSTVTRDIRMAEAWLHNYITGKS
jgi:RNA polymerase sigma factor (TIGR02999 family)